MKMTAVGRRHGAGLGSAACRADKRYVHPNQQAQTHELGCLPLPRALPTVCWDDEAISVRAFFKEQTSSQHVIMLTHSPMHALHSCKKACG